MSASSTLRTYYSLTKPGIIRGNLLSAVAGSLMASQGVINWGLLAAVLAGVALVIASGCVFNNYIDRNIDEKMVRTRSRALVTGAVSRTSALVYGAVLGLAGFMVLAICTNLLTVLIGMAGLFFYVVVYGVAKRRSQYGTLVGSIPGATPPVAGYTAVTGQLDTGALLLFLILVCWQMPHFYAIAMFRAKEYKAAHLPVLPLVRGMRTAKLHIVLYCLLFLLAALTLAVVGYAGAFYVATVGVVGLWWLWMGLRGFGADDDTRWARMMFGVSLLVLLGWSASLAIDATLL